MRHTVGYAVNMKRLAAVLAFTLILTLAVGFGLMAWKVGETVVVLTGALLTMVMVPAGIFYVIRETPDDRSSTPDHGRDPE